MNSSNVQVICSVNVFIRSRTRSWDAVWLWTRSRTRSPEIDQTRTRSRTCSQQAPFVNVFAERVRRPKKLRTCSAEKIQQLLYSSFYFFCTVPPTYHLPRFSTSIYFKVIQIEIYPTNRSAKPAFFRYSLDLLEWHSIKNSDTAASPILPFSRTESAMETLGWECTTQKPVLLTVETA